MAGRQTVSARARSSEAAVREEFAAWATEQKAKLIAIIDDATTSVRKVRVQRDCVKCGCKHIEFVEVANHEAAMRAVEFLMNQGFGRPGEDVSGRGGGGFVVERFVVEPEEE